jgi:hypothetical protein
VPATKNYNCIEEEAPPLADQMGILQDPSTSPTRASSASNDPAGHDFDVKEESATSPGNLCLGVMPGYCPWINGFLEGRDQVWITFESIVKQEPDN